MSAVGFECEHCHHRLSVPAALAGKPVRCPKCQGVVTAPAPSAPVPIVPDLSGAVRRAAEVESIFSNPDDEDGDSLFAGLSTSRRKPILPPSASDPDQPTDRMPGLPALPAAPTVAVPAPPVRAAPTEGVLTVVDMPAPRAAVTPVVPTDLADPFGRMVDEVVGAEADGSVEREPLAAAPGWMKWALVLVSVYATAVTVLAVWALTRPPVEKVIEKPVPVRK